MDFMESVYVLPESVSKMMHFVVKLMHFVLTMMNFVLTMMNFALKMMNFAFKMTNSYISQHITAPVAQIIIFQARNLLSLQFYATEESSVYSFSTEESAFLHSN